MKTQDQANAYTGHAKNGSPIQKHSQSDFYARYKIIMVFMPLRGTWVAMVGDKIITSGKDYTITLGAAVIRVIAAPAMGGLSPAKVPANKGKDVPLTASPVTDRRLAASPVTDRPLSAEPVGVIARGRHFFAVDNRTGKEGYPRLTRNEAEQDIAAIRIRNMMHS